MVSIIKKYLNDKHGMEHLQSMIIVAAILLIYELLLFYLNIMPTVRHKLKKFINSLKYDIDSPYLVLFKPLLNNNIILDVLHVVNDREAKIINKVNVYTIITGILLEILLIYILYLLHLKHHINMNVISISVIILILIFIFQYLFYVFGMNYNYIDSVSEDELEYFIIKNL